MNSPVPQFPAIYYVILLWSFLWKGLALWKAARGNQKYWFIVMLLLNTFGVVEIIFLLKFAKERLTADEVRLWFQRIKKK